MVTAEVTISKETLSRLKHPMQLVGIDWETYKKISEELGESTSFHLTYSKGSLTVMPLTELHEFLISFLERLIGFVSLTTRTNIFPTGNATMRSQRRSYGVEPDLSYFVSKSDIHRLKDYVPNEIELAPDIVVEIDLFHSSEDKFKIYGEFGVSEFWQYKNETMRFFKLSAENKYKEIERSEEIPILTSAILTEFLRRGQREEQFKILSDFQDWLEKNK